MTEPSQYFKGRTVQEQMDEVIGYVDTRAAEVATAAIASDVAQVHQDMLDADADAAAAAASAAAAAGTLANAVKKTGESSQTVEGDITMSTGDLGVAGDVGVQGQLSVLGGCDLRAPVTVAEPVNNTDAATKKYVDDSLAGYAPMVRTTGNQNISGVKTFTSIPIISGVNNDVVLANPPGIIQDATGTNAQIQFLRTICPDSNGVAKELMFLQLLDNSDGTRTLRLNLYSSTGVRGIKNIATIQADGTIS